MFPLLPASKYHLAFCVEPNIACVFIEALSPQLLNAEPNANISVEPTMDTKMNDDLPICLKIFLILYVNIKLVLSLVISPHPLTKKFAL
jgi:hypothetical protein